MEPDYEMPPQTGRTAIKHSRLNDPWGAADRLSKWDIRFLERAKAQAEWSKDPNTKVGAVIVDDRHHAVSDGFNGFPHGVKDADERLQSRVDKNELMIHAEMNALLFARCDLDGMTLYVWPYAPCVRCAVHIIQAGISRVVAPMPILESSWANSQIAAIDAFLEAGVSVNYFACVKLHDRPKDTVDWP